MNSKKKIDTDGAVMGPYSPGISVKDHIWLSGQIDISQDGIEEQTKGTLTKIDGLLEAAGSSREDLVKVTVLMTDIGFYSTINEVYSEWLGDAMPPPELHMLCVTFPQVLLWRLSVRRFVEVA